MGMHRGMHGAGGMMGMHKGMHGAGGMMGQGHMAPNPDKNLSAEDVRKILDGHLAFMGNKRLKVGDITEQKDGTFLAEIDTVDDSLVRRLRVDPKTGLMQPVTE